MTATARRVDELEARFRRLVLLALTLLAVAELLAATGIVPEPIADILTPYGFGQFFAMALLGNFVLHLVCGAPRRELAAAILCAAAGELVRVTFLHRAGWPPGAIASGSGLGAGAGSLAAQGWFALSRHDDRRQRRQVVLFACLLIDLFVLLSNPFVSLTATLHPLVLDPLVFAFDDSLGFQPSFVMGLFFARNPWLAHACEAVYLATPFGFAILWAAQQRARQPPPNDVLRAFLVASTLGFALYHAFPVVGPGFFFSGAWPGIVPTPEQVGLTAQLAHPQARNCVPSLHTTWVLLLWWHSRGQRWWLRAGAALFLLMTLMATLGNGLHYLADLVVAVPFAVMAQAAAALPSPARRRTMIVCGALLLGWLLLLRTGLLVHAPHVAVSLTWSLATVVTGLVLERRLWQSSAAAAAVPASIDADPDSDLGWLIAGAAGFAVSAHLSWSARLYALGVGGGPRATLATATIALAAFGVGVICGTRLLPRLDARRATVGAAVASALFFALSPGLAHLILAVQLPLLLISLLLFPSLLLGFLLARMRSTGAMLGCVALGAAAAALPTLDLLWPALGAGATPWLAALVELIVVLLALRSRPSTATAQPIDPPRVPSLYLVSIALIIGASATVTAHLLFATVGDTTYAYASMLTCALGALGIGARTARLAIARGLDASTARPFFVSSLAAALLGSVWAWTRLPIYFASFDAYAIGRAFGAREVVRFGACLVAVGPMALFAGAALASSNRTIYGAATRADTGFAFFAAAVGLLIAAPAIALVGSLRSVRLLAIAAASIGITVLLQSIRRRLVLVPLAVVAILALAQPRAVELVQLGAGEFVLFAPRQVGTVVAARESFSGGVELAVESRGGDRELRPARIVDGHAYAARPPILPAREPSYVIDDAADARPFLEKHRDQYQSLVIAAAPPWSVAGASLLTRELYAIAANALVPGGVLQQSIPLARLTPADFAALFAAARVNFAQLSLYEAHDEAVLVACRSVCPRVEAAPLLDGDGLDRLLAAVAQSQSRSVADLAATDDDAWFESRAPAATARPRPTTLARNLDWLRSFAH